MAFLTDQYLVRSMPFAIIHYGSRGGTFRYLSVSDYVFCEEVEVAGDGGFEHFPQISWRLRHANSHITDTACVPGEVLANEKSVETDWAYV
jgi:hypothetical protein